MTELTTLPHVSFHQDFQQAICLFCQAGQILRQRHFANAAYWSQPQIAADYPAPRTDLGQEFYVMTVDELPAGAAILQRFDDDLWQKAQGDALYISKMCTVPLSAAKNIPNCSLSFACKKQLPNGAASSVLIPALPAKPIAPITANAVLRKLHNVRRQKRRTVCLKWI